MVHQLLVDIEIDPEEVLARTDFIMKFIIKNIGNEPFPGGRISKLKGIYDRNVTFNYVTNKIIRVPRINPGDSREIQEEMFASNEGICWIELNIVSDDDELVDIYITEEMNRGQDFTYPLYIFKYEEMTSLQLLERILEKLEEINLKIGDRT